MKWIHTYEQLKNLLELEKYFLNSCVREKERWSQYGFKGGDLAKNNDTITSFHQITRIDDDIKRHSKRIEELQFEMEELENVVSKFKGIDNEIAYRHYLKGNTLYEIAEELGYSYQYIRNRNMDIQREVKLMTKM